MEPSPLAIMGVGEPPTVLRRFNWGAFLLPGWWTLLHGLWGPWLITFGMLWAWLSAVSLIRRTVPQSAELPQLALLTAAYMLADTIVALWFGYRGNAWIWKREISRTARGARRHLVSQYLWSERVWTWAGVVLFPVGLWGVWSNAHQYPSRIVGGVTATWVAVAFEVAALIAAFILSKRLTVSAAPPHA